MLELQSQNYNSFPFDLRVQSTRVWSTKNVRLLENKIKYNETIFFSKFKKEKKIVLYFEKKCVLL